ncbi:MAG: branched-chain amino acid ABC transporter permease [Methanomicrobiaceae archaeon]|nr:branched-chain amino acid ABC transporter permease [Methanomicrobiaceae archaeon]
MKLPKDLGFWGWGAALIVGLALPLIPGTSLYFLTVLIIMVIFIIYASAWNFLTYSGQGSLGHAAFFGIGGYASTMIALSTGVSPYLSIFLGGAVTSVVGLLIGMTCVRLKEWFLAMVTFGFAIIIQTLIVSQLAPFTGGWDGLAAPRLLPSSIPGYLVWEYYSILAIAVGTILVFHLLLKSRIGLALAAIRENELEARAAGVDPIFFKLLAFVISAFFAGVAGALEVHHFGYITPEIYGVDLSFWPIIYSITGGLGTLAGPVIGTVSVTILWDGLNLFGLTYERYIIIGAILVLTIIFLPKGLTSLVDKVEERLGLLDKKS